MASRGGRSQPALPIRYATIDPFGNLFKNKTTMDEEKKRKHHFEVNGKENDVKDQTDPPSGMLPLTAPCTTPAASHPKRRKVDQHLQITLSPIRKPPPLGSIDKITASIRKPRRPRGPNPAGCPTASQARQALRRALRPKSIQQFHDAVLVVGKEDPVYQLGGIWPVMTPAAAEAVGLSLCPISNPPGLASTDNATALPRNPSDATTSVGKENMVPNPRRLFPDIGNRLTSSNTTPTEAVLENQLEDRPFAEYYTTALDRMSQQIEEIKTCLTDGYHLAFLDFSKGTHNPFWKRTEQNHYKFACVLVAFFVCKKHLEEKKTIRYSALVYIIIGHAFGNDTSEGEDGVVDTAVKEADCDGDDDDDDDDDDGEIHDDGEVDVNISGAVDGEEQPLLVGIHTTTEKPKSFTTDQKKVIARSAILEAAKLLNVPRVALGVRCVPKGKIRGNFSLEPNLDYNQDNDYLSELKIHYKWGRYNNADLLIDDRWFMPDYLRPFKIVPHDGAMLVTLEKESIYDKIAVEPKVMRLGLIIATGLGQPPLALKAAVSQIQAMLTKPNKPVIHFGDCNPHGIHIMNAFIQTPEKWGWDSGKHCTPVVWGGLRPTQLTWGLLTDEQNLCTGCKEHLGPFGLSAAKNDCLLWCSVQPTGIQYPASCIQDVTRTSFNTSWRFPMSLFR
jgi:hypothetical protein